MSEQEEFEFRLRLEQEQVSAAPKAKPNVQQFMQNLASGAVRGAGSIGATLLTPIDAAARAMGVQNEFIGRTDRRSAMDEALGSLGADTNSLAYGAGKIGTEIAGTLGAGGVLGKAAMPLLSRFAPGAAAPVGAALQSFGTSTGLAPATLAGRAGDLALRTGAGGATGMASAGIINPNDAASGGMIGAALPGALQAGGKALSLGGRGVSNLIGEVGTHTGARTLQEAAKAGAGGGQAAETFLANMRGQVPMDETLQAAKGALANMRDARGAQYVIDKIGWSAASQPLKFDPIANSFSDVVNSLREGGHWKIGADEQAIVGNVAKVLKEFRDDPAMHTVVGFDALKQRLQAVYPESPAHRKAQRVVSDITGAVKDAIVQQAPDYAKAMKSYEQSISAQKEIERALSLGDRASADTAIRKLQSVTRNNANTNYGNRVSMVEKLQDAGGADLMPALAGQALGTWAPRGLGKVGAGLTAGASISNPALLGLLPFQSPRLMGEAAYYGGKAGGLLGSAIDPASFQYLAQAGLLGADR